MEEVYSELITDLYKHPVNYGELKDYNVKATGGNLSCGDLVEFTIKIGEGKIKEVKFKGGGCAVSVASTSLLTEKITGKTLEEVKKIRTQEIIDLLGGVIQTRFKCASLGKIVLDKAIEKWEKSGKKEKIELMVKI